LALREKNLEPLHHDFVTDNDIPLRKKSPEDVLAYRFQNGRASFNSRFTRQLTQIKRFSKKMVSKRKYDRTSAFIQRHYKKIDRE